MQRRRNVPTVVSILIAAASGCSGSGGSDGGLDARDAIAADHVGVVDGIATDAPIADGGTLDPLDPTVAPAVDMDPTHYPANVWVTDGIAKVQPTATPGATHWAVFSAARNEFESFQVHVRATSAPVTLAVTVSDLVDARSGTTIHASDHVTVFREEYLSITTLSDLNGTLGRTPDPLIPAVDPYVHETRTAFPVTVPPSETRSAWIDVQVPMDAPSGYYTGTVQVRDGTTTLATLPVRLAVWDFALPSTSSLRSGFSMEWNGLCAQAYGGYNGCGAYPGASSPDDAIERIHAATGTLFLDYRLSLGSLVYAPVTDGNFAHFDSVYGPLLNGTAPTRLPGAQLTHLWFAGDQTVATQLGTWRDHFTTQHWIDRTSVYYCDEPPNGCSWAQALSRAQFIHTSAPGLPTLLTTDFTHASAHGLTDAVDILVSIVEEMESPGVASERPSYVTWLTQPGKHLWWYQSCDEHGSCSNGTPGPASIHYPSYMVDATPVRNRVFQWLAYLYQIEGELYYDTDYCWTTACGDATTGTVHDPWTSIYAFGGNGDGTLYYPGTVAHIGGTTPVPIPSVRLALIRDGMEDYEYLHALDAAGDGAFAQTTAHAFVTNTYTFSDDPTQMAAARMALGNRLHHRVHP